MSVFSVIGAVFQIAVALTVIGYGLSAKRSDIWHVFRRPRLLIVSVLAMFVVMPVVALALELYLDFDHATRVAVVVLALTPIPALLPRTEIATGGRPSYAIGLAFAVAALSVVLVPFFVSFLGRVMSRPFGVSPSTIFSTVLVQILAPLAMGLLVQRLAPRIADRIGPLAVTVANVLMGIAILVLLVLVAPALLEVATLATLLGITLFVAAGLAVGHVMGGPDPDHAVVLALACANRNPGLAIGIAAANFPNESFAAVMILYAVLVGVVTKPYIRWQTRRLVLQPVATGTT
ncbi:MAG: bile acid:sodium symporter [Dermatophilaceae bacterium]